MATTLGFNYARLALIDPKTEKVITGSEGLADGGVFLVDATSSQGVISANISGLAPTMTKYYGSDRAVGVSGQGAGNVQVTFAVNDLPVEVLNKISGMKQDANGAWVLDSHSKPPYAALEMVSQGNDGKAVHFILYKGNFAPESRNLQTNTEQVQRVTDSITFTALNRNVDGRVYSEYWQADTKYNETAMFADVFPGGTVTKNADDDNHDASHADDKTPTNSGTTPKTDLTK